MLFHFMEALHLCHSVRTNPAKAFVLDCECSSQARAAESAYQWTQSSSVLLVLLRHLLNSRTSPGVPSSHHRQQLRCVVTTTRSGASLRGERLPVTSCVAPPVGGFQSNISKQNSPTDWKAGGGGSDISNLDCLGLGSDGCSIIRGCHVFSSLCALVLMLGASQRAFKKRLAQVKGHLWTTHSAHISHCSWK